MFGNPFLRIGEQGTAPDVFGFPLVHIPQLFFQLNSQAIGNAIDIRKVCRHLNDIMKHPGIKAELLQGLNCFFGDIAWSKGQFFYKFENLMIFQADTRRSIVCYKLFLQFIWNATKGPQRGPVMLNSVMAFVQGGDDNGDHFLAVPRQG